MYKQLSPFLSVAAGLGDFWSFWAILAPEVHVQKTKQKTCLTGLFDSGHDSSRLHPENSSCLWLCLWVIFPLFRRSFCHDTSAEISRASCCRVRRLDLSKGDLVVHDGHKVGGCPSAGHIILQQNQPDLGCSNEPFVGFV